MKCNEVKTKKKGHHFPDDQFLVQNVVKTKKKTSRLADVGHENIGKDAAELLGGIHPPIPPRFAPMTTSHHCLHSPADSAMTQAQHISCQRPVYLSYVKA